MMKRQQFGRHMHLFGCMSFSSGSCCFRLHMLLRNVCPCELIALLMLICFALPTLAASTNVPPLSTTQVVTNRDAPSNDGWVAPDFTKDPKSTVKGLFRGATSDSSAFFAFLAIIIPILYSILGVSLKVLFNKNLFAPFLWIVYLFSYRMRLRRFLKLFKGREVKCNPYVSIDRSCLCDVRRIVENGRIRSGVFFFYGQCDVGKKVALVGELHCKGMAVVQISEDKWFNSPETRVRCEELVTALECVFPPFRRKLHLVLVLDSQIKDHNGYRQILEQTLNLLYNQLSDGVRKRVSVVVKMVGMYAARDIPDIHPIMIEPLSSKECVAFSNDYCKKMAYPSKDETMDEHILYVNSMGHPSRLIKYLEGNSSDGPLDIKALQNWTECVVASADDSLRKVFYSLIYILAIVKGRINLDRLIELVTQQCPDSKEFNSLKNAVLLIAGSRVEYDMKHFDVDVLFENCQEARFLVAWNAGDYGIGSQCYYADVLPEILKRCEELLLASSAIVFEEEFSRRMIATCATNWTEVSDRIPRLIQTFERLEDLRFKHDIGMRLIVVAYRFEWSPRYGIAEDEDISKQIQILLNALQEICWPGWLDAMLVFAPLLCIVNPDVSTWGISDKTIEDHLRELAPDSRLPKDLQTRVAYGLAAIYCYGILTLSMRARVSGLNRANIVSQLRKFRQARARIWGMLDDGARVFILRLHKMLSLARVTERDIDAYHGEWSDKRCEAIRAFLDSACQIKTKTNEFSGVILAALKSQYYNLFLADDNHGIISELIQFWEQMNSDGDESQDGFRWTLKWYRACSESTECETPDDVLIVIDGVISELDISGNKCISGNPLTVVDMMWLVSVKANDIFGLKECSDGLLRLQARMLEVLKHWSPILCLRGRLRMLNYFSRMIGRIHLTEDDISWIVTELRQIYQWVNGDVHLYDNDELKAKILNVGTIVLYAMTSIETFTRRGDHESERDELLEMGREIIKYANNNNDSSVLCNTVTEILLSEGNLPLALKCLGLCGHADTKVDFFKTIAALSRRTRPQISTSTAFKFFDAIVDKLFELYERSLEADQVKPNVDSGALTVHTPIPIPDSFKDVVFDLLRKIESPLSCTDALRTVYGVGPLFCLYKYRIQLETAIIRFLVSSRVLSKEEAETLGKMSAKHIETLLDAGKIEELVEFCCFILERYPMLIDDSSFVRVYDGVKNNLLKETPQTLSEKRKKYETVYRILRNKNFVRRLKLLDISRLFAAWKEMRVHFNPDDLDDGSEFYDMDKFLIAEKIQEECILLEEEVANAEYVGKSRDGKISISLSSEEVSAINCFDWAIDIEEYFVDVKAAFDAVIAEKHKCLELGKEIRKEKVIKMAGEIKVLLDENFDLQYPFLGL